MVRHVRPIVWEVASSAHGLLATAEGKAFLDLPRAAAQWLGA